MEEELFRMVLNMIHIMLIVVYLYKSIKKREIMYLTFFLNPFQNIEAANVRYIRSVKSIIYSWFLCSLTDSSFDKGAALMYYKVLFQVLINEYLHLLDIYLVYQNAYYNSYSASKQRL